MSSSEESSPLLKDSFSISDYDAITQHSMSNGSSHIRATPRRDNRTTNFEAIMHLVKGNLGTGILAMPQAISQAGILVGTVCTLLLGIVCIHCMHLLVNCSHYLCVKFKKPNMDYADVAEAAFQAGGDRLARHSKKARHSVNVFLCITQLGVCSVYVLFISQNIKLVFQGLLGETLDSSSPYPMKTQLFELILTAFLVPLVFVKDIKQLAPFSVIANVATYIGISFILYYILIYLPFQSISRLPLFAGWNTFPLYFGTAIYAFEGIGMVLPVENVMREPTALPSLFGVLNVSMTIVCVLYITIGFYGYIAFGEDCQGSITLNIKGWFGTVVQMLFSVAVFITYGVQFYVPMTFLGPSLARSRLAAKIGPRVLDGLVRTLLVVLSFAMAAVCDDYLELLTSLIGSVASSALALIFPPLFEIITFWPERHNHKGYWAMFVKDIIIAVFGFICFLFGTGFSLVELIYKIG